LIAVAFHFANISSNITFHIYFALKIIIIHNIPYTISCIPFEVSSDVLAKNSLYAHIIPTNIQTMIIIGVTTFISLLKTKLLILSHHHIRDFGSAASKFFLIGAIALSIELSNLHILSTPKENFLELDVSVKSVSLEVKALLNAPSLFT